MLLLAVLVLSLSSPSIPEQEFLSPPIEISAVPAVQKKSIKKSVGKFFHAIFDSTMYLGAGAVLGSASILTGVGWGICYLTPWTTGVGRECKLLSQLCGKAALHSFGQIFSGSPSFFSSFKRIPLSQSSWHINQQLLSQAPIYSEEDTQLINFLQQRWLAKSTGCYPGPVNWIYPCYGIQVQVHPDSTNSYARDPGDKVSDTYLKKVETWKQSLPHPHHFPLILTRPADIHNYLPSCHRVLLDETLEDTIEHALQNIQTPDDKIILDLTERLPLDEDWLDRWNLYQQELMSHCRETNIDPDQFLCIQRLLSSDLGGIRCLPLSEKRSATDHHFLLERVSRFGMSANRVELDRCYLPTPTTSLLPKTPSPLLSFYSQKEVLSFLNEMEESWYSESPQKTLMFQGTLQVLKGLFTVLSPERWNTIMSSPTRSFITHLSLMKIQRQLQWLLVHHDDLSFFETATRLELVHADLTALLEILSPYQVKDFAPIYKNILTSIPTELQPLSFCALHASGMTSLAGIFKAVQQSVEHSPCILYGENTYFECIYAAEGDSRAVPTVEATQQDWEDADLILAQFNPALKRIDFKIKEYTIENIVDVVHRTLNAHHKPLTVALDCTLDYINSPKVETLLTEFSSEIAQGNLNVICYRSGIKYDLFGMDNYCGAPFFMIHNEDEKWKHFDSLLIDPALQTDRLSNHWFCLAYTYAAPYLENYRKQIFDNTRDLLNRVPQRLMHPQVPFRIIPMEANIDPSFIDFKVYGCLHKFRASLLAGGLPTIKAMEAGHPVFYRPSLGFYHPNLNILYGKDCSTLRLTLGLDPSQVDVFVNYFKLMDTLNDR